MTDRGKPVARLVPVAREETWQDLVDAGVIAPAEDPDLDLADIVPLPAVTDGPTLSEILQQMRDEERY